MLPILAGFFYATNILTIRKACREETTLALALAVAIAFLLTDRGHDVTQSRGNGQIQLSSIA